jgi:hypothetical protein
MMHSSDMVQIKRKHGSHSIFAMLMLSGCASFTDRHTEADLHGRGERVVVLRNLAYRDGVLEGEVLNRSARVARTVLIEVTFSDPSGDELLAQEFEAVPGGDGQVLLPEHVKHFSYGIALAGSAEISAVGKVVSIDYE